MKNTVILITHEGMGHAHDIALLPLTLIDKYLTLLLQSGNLPAAICFYTAGVKLTTVNSPVLAQLRDLEAKSVRLIICSTCLEAFGLAGEVQVGIVGGMPDILEAQVQADKVITL